MSDVREAEPEALPEAEPEAVPGASRRAAPVSDITEYAVADLGAGHLRLVREVPATGRKEAIPEHFVPLTNFTARIVEDRLQDDGVEQERIFVIEATTFGERRKRRIEVPARDFDSMKWVADLGARAMVLPGQTTRDHARAAIRAHSADDLVERRVYAHTGWVQIDGDWCYLHAAGAIGRHEVETRLSRTLDAFDLSVGDDPATAIRASLDMLDAAAITVTAPLIGAVYRAVLGETDFAVAIIGETGLGKSELAALAQQHFGATFDARHLPESWTSTANAIEGLLFEAKDTLIVIDDFKPEGSRGQVDRIHETLARVVRSTGNSAGRRRMRADGTLREPKPPRALTVITGEDYGRGHSIQARTLTLKLTEPVVGPHLDRHQRAAAEGRYAEAMAGYLSWLAPKLDDVKADARHRMRELRHELALDDSHARTPGIVADLTVGLSLFTGYALDVGAITEDEKHTIDERCLEAILAAGRGQAAFLKASQPEERFFELLAALLGSESVALATSQGLVPKGSEAIGWHIGDDLYLSPEVTFAAVRRLASDQGDEFTTSRRKLGEALIEHDLVVPAPDGRSTPVRTINKRSVRVWHLTDKAKEALGYGTAPDDRKVPASTTSGLSAFDGGEEPF